MKKVAALTGVLVAATVYGKTEDLSRRPNIVFFLVDDLGWGDLGCFGSTFHETPNIDRLCSDGMKFTRAYSACTVCSPSRAAILTGRYPARLHLTNWIAGHKSGKLKAPDWKKHIDHERITLPEALKEGAYTTRFIGKWHLIPTPSPAALWAEHTPEKHGFDGNIAGREWGEPKSPNRYFFPWDMPNLDGGKEGDFLTDRLTDKAEEFIDTTGQTPFLLYMSYYAVHVPVMAKPEYVEKYGNKLKNAPEGTYTQTDPEYAGLLQSVDDSVGRVVEKLRSQEKLDNTIFIFTSDNGGLKDEYNGGLRGTKGTSFEGGTRVDTFIVWPGVTTPGSQCDTPIIGTDFYPTILEMAGLSLKPEEHKDGVSLTPLLKQSGTLNRDALYWHYPHYHKTKPYGAIQEKGWKLIEFFEDDRLMLFDLNKDPNEEKDLARSQPEKAAELLEKLKEWRTSVGAQMPVPNPNFDPKNPGKITKQR